MSRIAAALLLAACLAGGPARAGGLTLVPAAPAGIFAPGADIRIEVSASIAPLPWRLRDLDGRAVAGGTMPAAPADADLDLGSRPAGYYTLTVGSAALPLAALPLAVVPVPAGRPDPRFQVVTHFALGWPTDLLPLAARAGIAGIRDELPWNVVEKPAGTFAFPANLEAYPTEAHRLGLGVLVPLDYANPAYDHGETPHSPAGIAAYARYAEAVLDHFGDRIDAVEVWNEYNGAFATGPALADRPGFYARLLAATAGTLRHGHPDTVIVGGGVAGTPLPYWDRLRQAGALADMDVAQIHPYADQPEDAGYDAAILKTRLGKTPLWATEAGAYDPKDRRGTAADLVRLYAVLLGAGVDRIYWYALREDPGFSGTGLLETTGNPAAPYAPAPAYAGYATLIRMLQGSRFVARDASDPRTRSYLFRGHAGDTRVIWSEDGPARIALETRQPLVVTRLDGGRATVAPDRGWVTLVLGTRPVYVRGAVARLAERRPDRELADSVAGFSGRQGDGGWRYGTVAEGGAGFRAARWSRNDWSCYWADPGYALLSLGRTTAAPSVTRDVKPVAAVRRWRSPVAGPARILLQARRDATQGTGVHVQVRVDGRLRGAVDLGMRGGPRQAALALPVRLRAGSLVDVAVLPATADLDFDTTVTRIRILADRR